MAGSKGIVLSPKCQTLMKKKLREIAATVRQLDLELEKLVETPQHAFVLIASGSKKKSSSR
jgi:hypothetical protein